MTPHTRYWAAKKVTLIGAVVNALLGLVKIIGGLLYHSHALVADGVHSFSDLVTDVMVLFASKYGSQDADDSHPYGHQRIETAATFLLALLLILAGCGIAWDALDKLIYDIPVIPQWITLPIIFSSILANELLFHYTHHVGTRINSPILIANAWHHRSDAASSLVVFFGLVGSLAGYASLDTFAALIVGLIIVKMGWDYGWNSIKELVDTAVDNELTQKIEGIISQIGGVQKIHQLRTRFMGNDVFIDVHIMVSPRISVSEGHHIAQEVHHTLVKQIDSVKDVIVHVDPEDDERSNPSLHLPNRQTLNTLLFEIHHQFPHLVFWNLHYLDGKITLDVICEDHFQQWQALHQALLITLKGQTIREIRLLTLQQIIRLP